MNRQCYGYITMFGCWCVQCTMYSIECLKCSEGLSWLPVIRYNIYTKYLFVVNLISQLSQTAKSRWFNKQRQRWKSKINQQTFDIRRVAYLFVRVYSLLSIIRSHISIYFKYFRIYFAFLSHLSNIRAFFSFFYALFKWGRNCFFFSFLMVFFK